MRFSCFQISILQDSQPIKPDTPLAAIRTPMRRLNGFSSTPTRSVLKLAVKFHWDHFFDSQVPPECGAAIPGENTTPLESATAREYSDGSGKYRLVAFISHMGSSPHSGHYVAHVKKDDRWVRLFLRFFKSIFNSGS